MAETKNLLLFRKWDLSNIEVKDPGLKTAISLHAVTGSGSCVPVTTH